MADDPIKERLFTTADASRIVGVSAVSARRWLAGYSYAYKGTRRVSPARLGTQVGDLDGILLMSFLDLIEVQMAVNLRRHHVAWAKIDRAAEFFRQSWSSDHPFALQRFRTDGRGVMAEIGAETHDRHVIDIANNQYIFDAIIEQSLFDVLDFREDGVPWRLWVKGRGSQVVVDPDRAFGQPIIESLGVPVATLVTAYAANDNDIERVARWFDIPAAAVEAALRFSALTRIAA